MEISNNVRPFYKKTPVKNIAARLIVNVYDAVDRVIFIRDNPEITTSANDKSFEKQDIKNKNMARVSVEGASYLDYLVFVNFFSAKAREERLNIYFDDSDSWSMVIEELTPEIPKLFLIYS